MRRRSIIAHREAQENTKECFFMESGRIIAILHRMDTLRKGADRWITAGLVLFCGVMTWLLVRSEYFPELSLLHRLPPHYILDRFLKNESSSTLEVTWKGENIGECSLRVIPGEKILLYGSTKLVIPILGQKPKFQMKMDCRLKSNRAMDRLHLQGQAQEMNFDLLADTAQDRVRLELHGDGLSEKREFVLSEILRNGGRGALEQIPELSQVSSLSAQEAVTTMAQDWKVMACLSRVLRRGDWMEAYFVETRLDRHSWARLWMSPTGDILKLESSFGLSVLNVDFFEGLPAGEKKADFERRQGSILPKTPA